MEKELLSQHLRRKLCEKYGNIASATRTLHIDYERTKKCLQINKFPADILSVLLLACDITEDHRYLKQHFMFEIAARFFRKKTSLTKNSITPTLTAQALLSEADLQLLADNALIRERVIELIKRECEWARTLLILKRSP